MPLEQGGEKGDCENGEQRGAAVLEEGHAGVGGVAVFEEILRGFVAMVNAEVVYDRVREDSKLEEHRAVLEEILLEPQKMFGRNYSQKKY